MAVRRCALLTLLSGVAAAGASDGEGACTPGAVEIASGLLQMNKEQTESVVLASSGGSRSNELEEVASSLAAGIFSEGSVLSPSGAPAVSVQFSLRDVSRGIELWSARSSESGPILAQAVDAPHVQMRDSSELHLSFDAHGIHFEYDLHAAPSVFSPNATIVATVLNGTDEVVAPPSDPVFVSSEEDAMLTMVGGSLKGTVRQDDTFFEVEVPEGASLLSVTGGVSMGSFGSFKRSQQPQRWTNCYTYDYATRNLDMGAVMGSKLYMTTFNDYNKAVQWIQLQFARANLVYKPQLNFNLRVGHARIETYWSGYQNWDQGNNCHLSINQQLERFNAYQKPVGNMGLWHLFDNCYVSGAIGLAYLGTLCSGFPEGVSWYSGEGTWRTFAHEVGHNFGGQHPFDQGQGRTGGIMDYGDGTYNGIFQFNTQFRKNEMCAVMNRAVNSNCPAICYYNSC